RRPSLGFRAHPALLCLARLDGPRVVQVAHRPTPHSGIGGSHSAGEFRVFRARYRPERVILWLQIPFVFNNGAPILSARFCSHPTVLRGSLIVSPVSRCPRWPYTCSPKKHPRCVPHPVARETPAP